MNQLEKLIELFDKSIALSSKKKRRLRFDEEVGIMALKIGRLISTKTNRTETDLFLSQCDKAVKYGFDIFAYKLHNLRFKAETSFAIDVLFLAMRICKVKSDILAAYRVNGEELELLKKLLLRIRNSEEDECKEYAYSNEIEKLMLRSQNRKQYAPPLSKILRKHTLKYKIRNSKDFFTRKVNKAVARHKDAFIRPHPYNNTITIEPILVNPNQKWIKSISARKWRTFYLNDRYIAKCARCKAIITSGFKSMDDYICSDCRFMSYSHSSIWTVKKR